MDIKRDLNKLSTIELENILQTESETISNKELRAILDELELRGIKHKENNDYSSCIKIALFIFVFFVFLHFFLKYLAYLSWNR